jgi:hypothetical protein
MLFSGQFEAAGLGRPTLSIEECRELRRQAMQLHALDATAPPWTLARAEGYDLRASRQRRVSACIDNTLILPPLFQLDELWLTAAHERAHGILGRLCEPGTTTEADAWVLTYVLTEPALAECPAWWVETVTDAEIL